MYETSSHTPGQPTLVHAVHQLNKYVLNRVASGLADHSTRVKLHPPGRPVHSDTNSTSLGSIQPCRYYVRRLFIHISIAVYSQVLTYTAERIGGLRDSNPVLHYTAEPPRSTQLVKIGFLNGFAIPNRLSFSRFPEDSDAIQVSCIVLHCIVLPSSALCFILLTVFPNIRFNLTL